MCFSAGASFAASAVLATVGVATLKKVQTKIQVPFAAIPMTLSLQQLSEGFVWIGLSHTDHSSWVNIPIYIFLLFAQVVWPSLIPVSILLIEKNTARKKILRVLSGTGAIISIYLLYCLLLYDVDADIRGFHIHYTLDFPVALIWISGVFYFIPTVIPLFTSGVKKMWLLGLLIVSSFLFIQLFLTDYLISVWCYFAAIFSVMILYILHESEKDFREPVHSTAG